MLQTKWIDHCTPDYYCYKYILLPLYWNIWNVSLLLCIERKVKINTFIFWLQNRRCFLFFFVFLIVFISIQYISILRYWVDLLLDVWAKFFSLFLRINLCIVSGVATTRLASRMWLLSQSRVVLDSKLRVKLINIIL